MKVRILKVGLSIGLILLIFIPLKLLPTSTEAIHNVWAIKDCKIVPVTGPTIKKGVVVIRNGLIEAVGSNVPVPPDAEVLNGEKFSVYPGFIDALGTFTLKMPQEKYDASKRYSGKYTDKDRGITPGLKAFDYTNLSKATLTKYHRQGITTVHTLPQRGVFTGQASMFSMSDADKNKAVLLKDTWLGIGFSSGGYNTYPGSLMGIIAFLRQEFSDVEYYGMNKSRWSEEMKGITRPQYNARYETILPYAKGKRPVVFLCPNQHAIRRAIKLGNRLGLRYVILDSGGEAFKTIPELKKNKANVLLTLSFKTPATSIHNRFGKDERTRAETEIYPKNAAKLAKAGIPFAFSSIGTDDPEKFIKAVKTTIEHGLSPGDALKALTIDAASILGVDKALGSIEPGKIANLLVSEGEILGKETKVKYLFADGKKFEIKAKAEAGAKPTVNITGRWEITTLGSMSRKVTMEFKQEEASLSGRMTSRMGTFEFEDGTVSGNEFTIEVTISFGGSEIDLYFSGEVEGDTMTGTVAFGTFGSAEFTGKRIP
jgi:imidazolonepropionase-like amidohydrolase